VTMDGVSSDIFVRFVVEAMKPSIILNFKVCNFQFNTDFKTFLRRESVVLARARARNDAFPSPPCYSYSSVNNNHDRQRGAELA
jgi:hypothetical protein